MSTYRRVRQLVDDLSKTSAVQKRRAAGKELQELMAKPEIRKNLANEAGQSVMNQRGRGGRRRQSSTVSLRVARQKALSSVWRSIVRATVVAVESIYEGKVKFAEADVNLLYKIVQACDVANEGFEDAYSNSKLSRKETKLVTHLCVRLLEDEEVLKVAESRILDTLVFVCSSSEYVTHFKPHSEIVIIMEEAEKRISADEGTVSRGIVERATKLFDNLIKTSCDLGISLNTVMPGSIKLVASWCARIVMRDTQENRIRQVSEQSRVLLSAVCALISSNAEQAIAPIRRHGRPLLSFARRRYASGDGHQRRVLNEYILCHIHISQVAGKLQGLNTGDLGDLGDASLTFRHINALLELVMRDNLKQDKADLPLPQFQKTQLELTAKLLACAQRVYIGNSEWELLGNPTDSLISMVQDVDDVEDYLNLPLPSMVHRVKSCPPKVMAKSPFVSHVFQPLYNSTLQTNAGGIVTDCNPSSQLDPELTNTCGEGHPLLQVLRQSNNDIHLSRSALVPLLQVLTAAAESFPAGACWVSSCQASAWQRVPAAKDWGMQPFSILGSSPSDLAIVVHVLASILLSNGGAGGDAHVQRWALLALINLTHASAIQSFFHQGCSGGLANLKSPWRFVWSVLFRSDQRYIALTKDPSPGSVGDLVILLVDRMVCQFCTDPGVARSDSVQLRQSTFIYTQQQDVWGLPVFWNPCMPDSTSCFDLIQSILHGVGLSEMGSDRICQSLPSDEFPASAEGLNLNRRYKLLNFCLQALGSVTKESTIAGVSMCLTCLTHGTTQPKGSGSNNSMVPGSLLEQEYEFLSITKLGGHSLSLSSWPLDPSLHLLWTQPPSVTVTELPGLFFTDEVTSDSARMSQLALLKAFETTSKSSIGADFVASSHSTILLDFSLEQLSVVVAKRLSVVRGEVSRCSPTKQTSPAPSGDLPLSFRTLFMKVALNIILHQNSSRELSLKKVEQELSDILTFTTSVAESAPEDEDAKLVFSHIWQITQALQEATSEGQFCLPRSVVKAAAPLCTTIQDLLSGYIKGGNSEQYATSQTRKPSLDDDLMADDDDDSESDGSGNFDNKQRDSDSDGENARDRVGQKRKSRSKESKGKRIKSKKCMATGESLGQGCAFLLASVLVGIEPNTEVCQDVAKALLGVEDILYADETDIDPVGGAFACRLFCTEPVVLQDSSPRDIQIVQQERTSESVSIVSLVCNILKVLRGIEVPDIGLQSFCFWCCSNLVCLAESDQRGASITDEEASLVTDILTQGAHDIDRQSAWLRLRPKLRATQICAAAKSFLVAKDTLHSQYVKEYPSFVLKFLPDLEGTVRRRASHAICAAIQVLPDPNKVINSVRKYLPPLSVDLSGEDARKAYRTWLESRRAVPLTANGASEDQVWEDAFLSVESGVIDCWATIACTTTNNDVILSILFDLVKVSCSRPEREFLAFQAVDFVAQANGFERVDDIMDAGHEDILYKWVEESKDSLLNLPLLLSSPAVLFQLLVMGKHFLNTSKALGEQGLDAVGIKESAASEFMIKSRRTIMPLVILFCVSKLPEASIREAGGPNLYEDQFMKEMSSMFEENYNIDVVRKVVKSHIPDIIALQALLSNGNESQKTASAKIDLLLNGLLSGDNIQRLKEKNVSSSIRWLLDICGAQLIQGSNYSERSYLYSQSISSLIEQYGGPQSDCGDLFRQVRSTASEFFILARYKLTKNAAPSLMRKRYTALQVLCDLVMQQLARPSHMGLQVAFYTHTLSMLLFDAATVAIHPLVITTIKMLVHETALHCEKSRILKDELRLIARDLLCACMHIHENCQRDYVSKCLHLQHQSEKAQRQRQGFLGDHSQLNTTTATAGEQREVIQSALIHYKNSLNEDLISTLEGTYQIIQVIVENGSMIGLDSDAFVGASPPYETPALHCELLARVDSSFNAQALVSGFLEVQGDSTPALQFLEDVSIRKCSRQSPTEQRIILAKMREVQNFLCSDSGQTFLSNNNRKVGSVVRALAVYCGDQYHEEVRLAASHCLGEVGAQLVHFDHQSVLPSEASEHRLDEAIKKGQVELALFSQCAEDLVKCLKSSETNKALVALDTLKAVIGSNQGTLWKKYFEKEESLRLLTPLIGARQSNYQSKDIFLTDREIEWLKQKAYSICGSAMSGKAWCWNEQLWRCGALGGTSFEEWICCVMPAILVLCYRKPVDSNETTNLELRLQLCQRMSCIDPGFASSIFPAVILDLLANSRDNPGSRSSDIDGVLEDTYVGTGESEINKEISCCFTALLQSCSNTNEFGTDALKAKDHSPAVTLVLDTLDCFRRLTQSRFMESTKHKKNPVVSSKSKDLDTSRDFSQGDEEPLPWRGVPFGTILRLDGLLVARACLNAKRPASAIFFAEMYADSRYGGSSSISEKIRSTGGISLCNSSLDISGFAASEIGAESKKDDVHNDSLCLLRLLRDSFFLLGEENAGSVLEKHVGDLQFSVDQNPSALHVPLNNQHHTLSSLMQLDNVTSQTGNSSDLSISTVSCLQGLGLRNVSQSFLRGLISDPSAKFSNSEGKELRDKWFECSLSLMQWNDPIFNTSVEAQQSSPWNTAQQDLGKLAAYPPGFHEQVVEAVHALSDDDYEFSLAKVREGRKLLIHQVPSVVHPEIPLTGLFDCAGRFQALNKLESIVGEGSCPIKETLRVHCQHDDTHASSEMTPVSLTYSNTLTQSAVVGEFGECMTEVTLRSMYYKAKRASKNEEASLLLERLIMQLWSTCKTECLRGHSVYATGALGRLRSLFSLSPARNCDVISLLSLRLQEARMLERQGDFTGAIRQAAQVVTHLDGVAPSTDKDSLMSEALVACGRWKGRHKVEPADSILQNYLKRGASLSLSVYEAQNNNANRQNTTAALLELSQLASSLFETVSQRVQSAEWRTAGQILSERELELKQCDLLILEQQKRAKKKSKSKESKDAQKKMLDYTAYRINLGRQVDNAKGERLKIEGSIEDYRKLSLQSTVSALSIANTSGKNDLSRHVYRMISLWFSSEGTKQHDIVNSIISEAVDKIPSFRFVPLASQLFSRLGQDGRSTKDFNNVLKRLLFIICLDHPYHCLVHLIYVSNGKKVGAGVSGRNASAFLENANSSKVDEANLLINKLKNDNDFTRSLVESYQTLARAYIALALAPVGETPRGEGVQFSKLFKSAAESLDRCLGSSSRRLTGALPCILTKNPPIDPCSDYNRNDELGPVGTELVVGFDKMFAIAAGGNSKPRIVVCFGSRGGKFKQLVKGHDEIRQDAVMEQVFEYVNELMFRRLSQGGTDEEGGKGSSNSGRAESQSNLKVVTYNIVPLSPASGVLEWVEDTIPFFDCIIDRGSRKSSKAGLHSRYYPGEWSQQRCNKHFQSAQQNSKRQAFDEICRFHSPCLRFFFVERFGHSMQAWYSAKLRYARSVAVSSVVGHVLGIGDRHGSNILVHEKSGEVVHIDFGIVFEQGKLLNIPEKVPFRLTRNMVDGLGPTGTEGLFTEACEETLLVLKRDASALLTILSAVVADPLYTWSMSPVKARERQKLVEQDEDTEGRDSTSGSMASANTGGEELCADQNEAAAAAISKIQEKLNGYEDGTSGEQQSVEGQIQLLINSARDRDQLCEMFHGWGPWT